MKATMTSKGQITVPIGIRKKLKLDPGQVLDFDEKASCLKATKVFDAEKMRSVIGCCKDKLIGKSTMEWLEELRGPVELPPEKPVK